MRNFTFIFMLSIIPLMADFYPSTVESSISSVNQNSVTLTQGFPAKGMNGIIIHNYGKGLKAITGYLRYESGNKGTLVKNEPIEHEQLPAVKSKVHTGDKVIGGYLYNTLLVLAPDANTHAKIIESADKNWVHPDLYAMFLSKEGDQFPTQDNLQKFANEYQVGLIYIVQKGKAVLYDPFSRRTISEKPLTGLPSKGQFPFYMRLDKIKAGWFSKEATGEYYQQMGSIQ